MDFDAQNAISPCLYRDEKILWCAKSASVKAPYAFILFLTIFFAIWGGGVVFFIYCALLAGSVAFVIIGAAFLLVILYFMVTAYTRHHRRYKNAIYALTDQRVFIALMENGGRYKIDSKVKIPLIQSASMACREDGVGDIIFDLKVCKSEYQMDPEAVSEINYHKQPPDDCSRSYADRYCTVACPFEVVSDRVYGGNPPVNIKFLHIDSCKDVFDIFKKANPDFVESKPPAKDNS